MTVFSKRKLIAILTMVAMILVAIWGGSYHSLSSMAKEVSAVFYNGENGDGLCIQHDLDARADVAINMVSLAKKYLPESDTAVQNVIQARAELLNASGISEKYRANDKLTQTTTDLYYKLQETELSETDQKYPARFFDQLSSYNDTISRDPYNRRAEEFNQMLETFPANILSTITFVDSVELYNQGGK